MTYRAIVDQQVDPADRVKVLTWENVEAGDECEPIDISQFPDASVHIFIKSGSGTTIALEGSNDKRGNRNDDDHANADFQTVKDSDGQLISTTSNKLYQKITNTWWLRPVLTDGDAVVDISIHMVRAH